MEEHHNETFKKVGGRGNHITYKETKIEMKR